jgi:ureidoacrylate peracid hydrolase
MDYYIKLIGDLKFEGRKVNLDPKPEPIRIDLQRTAVVVVDMQNAFCGEGGMLELMGVDVKLIKTIVRPCVELVNAMRIKECKIIYF